MVPAVPDTRMRLSQRPPHSLCESYGTCCTSLVSGNTLLHTTLSQAVQKHALQITKITNYTGLGPWSVKCSEAGLIKSKPC